MESNMGEAHRAQDAYLASEDQLSRVNLIGQLTRSHVPTPCYSIIPTAQKETMTMTSRYTVEIVGAGEDSSNSTPDTNNKHDALADANNRHKDDERRK